MTWIGSTRLACGVVVVLASSVASAQSPASGGGQTAPQQGPLVLEKVQSGAVAAPDIKATDIDGHVGTLIGGYAGWLTDETLLIGGGGYWLANGRDETKMAYGGVVVGWTLNGSRRIGFGFRGLVGAGQATLIDTIAVRGGVRPDRRGRMPLANSPEASTVRFAFDRDFFVAEPQCNIVVRLTRAIRLDGGVGYRLVGAAGNDNDRLRGITGSVAIRFGGGN
jgi:hypothetical protein